jgi:pseudouridine-5'-phosphate glycosidase/pseudouridine kinase
MRTDGIRTLPSPNKTAQYVAVNNAHKDLALAMADMSILESSTPTSIQETWLSSPTSTAIPPKCVIVDANWSPECLHAWLRHGKCINATTIFEPVSTAKSTRLFTASDPGIFPTHTADLATPNTHELIALHNQAYAQDLFNSKPWFRVIDALGIPSSGLRVPLAYTTTPAIVDAGIPQQAIKLLPFIPTLLTKLGPGGVLLTKLLRADDPVLSDPDEAKYVLARNGNGDAELGVGGLYVRLFEPGEVLAPEEVVSVNGIGDTFLGALSVGLVKGGRVQDVVGLAQRAAGLSLRSKESVSPELRGLRGEVYALAKSSS